MPEGKEETAVEDIATSAGRLTRFMRLPEVKKSVGLGRTVIYERISRGEFPAPINLGARAVGWLESDIAGWIDERVAASRNAARQ